ncbi:GTPase-activating protein [Dissophora ornata]|nr:GTPase-activating protein [Dissophora ornata]
MMVNKHNAFASVEVKDYDPIDSYGALSDAEPNSGHAQPNSSKAHYPTPKKDSRNSWEENGSDDEPYPADAYDYARDYGDEDEDEDEDEDNYEESRDAAKDSQDEATDHKLDHQHQTPTTFDQESDDDNEGDKPLSRNLFRVSATNPNQRASVNSGRSYSSHTKHHSFGYDEDRPELSETESESSSESDSDREEEAYTNAPSSPPAPPISSGSRPVSSTFSVTRTLSKPSSPSLTHSTVSNTAKKEPEAEQNVHEEQTTVSSSFSSPTLTEPSPSKASELPVESTSTEKRTSLVNFSDQNSRRASGSESDASNPSSNVRPTSINGQIKVNQRPGMFPRPISGSSSSRGFPNGHSNNAQNRPSSYTDLSDAELNEISLDEPTTPNAHKRRSVGTAAPRVPVAASNAGFPSSFFGGKPHPKSQQYPQSTVSPSATAGSSPPLPPTASSTSPEPRAGGVLNGSISSIASSIQGAFMGRGFGGSSSTSTLPHPGLTRTPSRTSARGSIAGMAINTSSTGIDLRSSSNVSPERASMYSSITTDSNMDLLLQRLEAENSIVEQDSRRRMTNESDMDRAFGHAKEESVDEDVDWDYWGSLMHDYNGVVKKNPRQLTQMIQKGVPAALRGLIWQLLAKSKDAQLEASYAELLKSTSSHEKQITRDMSRTFPNHEYFQAEGLGQESLFNVVKAYSLYDKEVGYCQGLSFVVGPLLLNMPDEEAFCVLVRLMNTYDMRGHFTPDMNMLQLRLYQYEQLMEETVPLVYKHFQNQGIQSTMYASQWFMTLFAYKFPLDLVFRIYDILFVEGVESLFRFAIALLKANHDKILNHDFDKLIELLKNGLFEPYKNNPSLFVQDAYSVKVTPKKLAQFAQKYNAMVQRQQAELAAEESLRETNRKMSMDVRRLEGSLHTLNKEHVDLAKDLIARKMEMADLQDQNDVLSQKVSDLTRIVDSQAKEVEDRLKAEIQSVMEKNVELIRKNQEMEDHCHALESLLIDTKMKYAESENERDTLTRKLGDLRRALGAA